MKYKVFGYLTLKALLVGIVALFFSSAEVTTSAAGSTDRTRSAKPTMASVAPSAIFTNSTPITINDEDPATPYPSAINVTGLGGNVTSVKVTLNGFTHTFPDDIGVLLKGPGTQALLLMDGVGDDPDVTNVTFTLVDGGTVLPATDAWGPGNWKPTAYFTGDAFPAPGPGTTYSNPGPAGGNTATFASTFNGTPANGTWSLYVIDFVLGDEGAIPGGWTLEITSDGAPPAAAQHVLDYDGDGKTDYTTVRNTGGGSGGQVTWFVDSSSAAPDQYVPWGISSDFFVDGDFDGDNKSDITVWRGGASGVAAYYILQSQTSTVRAELFGQTGDDPNITGDYNDDGNDDLAVYRGGATAGDPSFWYWRTTAGGGVFTAQWGQNGDFPAPGDYDGDGMADLGVQRNNGAGQGVFLIHYGAAATGTLSSVTTWGTSSDLILPGDYDGDGKTDLAVARGSGGQIVWSVKVSGGGTDIYGVPWGLSATDIPTQGDYDGDGKTDIAVWRPNADTSNNYFLVRKSADGNLQYSEWGQQGDYPVANYNSH